MNFAVRMFLNYLLLLVILQRVAQESDHVTFKHNFKGSGYFSATPYCSTDLAGVRREEREGASAAAGARQLGVEAAAGGDGDGAVEAGVRDAQGAQQAMVRVHQILCRMEK